MVLALFQSNGQSVLSGIIVNDETQQPIYDVEIEIHETHQSAWSDKDGRFSLILENGNYHLHFLSSTFEAQDLHIQIKGDTSLTLYLKPTYLELKEIMVEESNLKTAEKNSSLDIQYINFGADEKAASSTLAEALKKNPGLNAFNTGVGIAKPVIRGFTATRVSVFDNGVKQEGQQWGMDHGLEIDPFNTDRVEIIKGAGALQYGSDATGGVVKLLPDAVPEKGLHGQFTSLYKSNNNTIGNSGKLSYSLGDQFIILRVSKQQYDDFKVPATEFLYNGFILPIVDNTLKNTAGELNSYRLTYGIHKSAYNLRVNLSSYQQKVGLFSGAIGIPRAFDLSDLGSVSDIDVPYQEVVHNKLNATLNYRVGENWLNTTIGYQFNNREEHSRPDSHGLIRIEEGNTLSLDLDLYTLSQNSRFSWRKSDLNYTVGLDQQYQRNFKSGWEFLIPDFAQYTASSYFIVEKRTDEKWSWNAGARLHYGNTQSKQHLQPYFNDLDSLVERAQDLDRQFFNYAISGGVAYNPSNEWNFKLNLAKTFRMPVAAELASNGVHHGTFRHEMGNPDLEMEEGFQLDLSSSYQLKDLYLKLTPFVNYFTNYIYLRPTASFSDLPDAGQLYAYSEAEALHNGFEFFAEYHPISSIHLSSALEYVNNLNLDTKLPLPFTPPLSNIFMAEYERDSKSFSWSISAEYQITAAQNNTDRNEDQTPAYQLLHFNSSVDLQWKGYKISVGASLLNALDRSYLNHLSRYRILNIPEQGRNLVVNVNFHF